MKWFHTADWHLGKLVQGVYMTEDQRYVLEHFIADIERERPDAVIIAGDLYDRAIPPIEAVELLDEVLQHIVIKLETPVLAVAGNHDSPDRIDFGTAMMASRGLHIAGRMKREQKPVVLRDEHGEVHFHLMPYADPAHVRYALENESIRTHDDAMKALTERLRDQLDPAARHVFIGHAFVTATGEAEPNTSDSERPLAIGGAEHVRASYFAPFHYTALGHLHQAHYVSDDKIRYAGSPLKYSISEENHAKGYYIVEMDDKGAVMVEKRPFQPLRDLRRVSGTIEEIEQHALSDDYVFITLLNENPVLFPMEKVRAIYPNALHVERRPEAGLLAETEASADGEIEAVRRREADPIALFASFYQEVKGSPLSESKKQRFADVFGKLLHEEGGGA